MTEPKHINELLPTVLSEIGINQSPDWNTAERNRNITARDRNMKKISEMLGMDYREVPLIKPEAAA